ncbi:MAG: carboxypeptidase-like regulatory domain-containing protein [Flavobacteriales bacterium]|nr:carboxypeptidase-like regulatory domain-containing protein [Flavobacteriales bacterium]
MVELYTVAKAGLGSFRENKASFVAHKGKYDDPYADNLEAQIDAAMALPSLQMRDMRTEVAGIQLKVLAQTCLDNWQALKLYIRDVAGWKDEQKPRLEGAGWKDYAKAAAFNWEYVELLNNQGSIFIGDFEAELLAGNNMPGGFRAQYEAGRSAYATLLGELIDAKQDNPQETKVKMDANNALYDTVMDMFEDGRYIAKGDRPLADRFTFARVLNKIRKPTTTEGGGGGGGTPTGDGNVKGKVTGKADGMPLVGALVTFSSDVDKTFTTDSNGLYDSGAIKNGDYAVKVWDENHEQIETTLTVNGNMVQDFAMDPLV